MLIVRWPVMVGVVTEVPAGHRLEPREMKVTSEPELVETPYRSASQANNKTSELREDCVGWAVL